MREAPGAMFDISTDPGRIDRDLVHRFLSEESYWARERPRAATMTAIDHSLCFGAYEDGRMLAFGRAVTDRAVFGYLADVFVVAEARGRGLGKALVAAMVEHPDLQVASRLVLATYDAEGLYAQFGFVPLDDAQHWLQRRPAG